MIALFLFLILAFLVGKFFIGAAFSVAGAVICLVLVFVISLAKRRRR